jgi:hypothetical protein
MKYARQFASSPACVYKRLGTHAQIGSRPGSWIDDVLAGNGSGSGVFCASRSIATQATRRSRPPGMGQAWSGAQAQGRKRAGGDAGHPGAQRKLVPVEELKALYDVKPSNSGDYPQVNS